MLADELHRDPGLGELPHQRPQVIEVAGQPVHRVDHDGVAVADVAAQVLQGGTVAGRAGEVVGEHPVHRDAVELAIGALICGRHTLVAHALSGHLSLPRLSG